MATHVARLLESLPGARRFLSAAYRRAVYVIRWRPSSAAQLAAGVEISDVDGTAKGGDPSASTFFGYYEKLPWSEDGQSILYHRVSGDGPDAQLMLSDGYTVHSLGETSAWNWQQGAMLQWLPNVRGIALYNVVANGHLRTRLVDGAGRQVGEWDRPVQALSPSGQSAVSLNYLRLQVLRPEYGYRVRASNFSADMPASEDGLWVIDTVSGDSRLAVSLQQLAHLDADKTKFDGRHKVNHALYNPSGTSVVFLHRWFATDGRRSRLMVADTIRWTVKPLHESRVISHYCWLNDVELLCWCRGEDGKDAYHRIDVDHGTLKRWLPASLSRWGDGHPSSAENGQRVVTDSYPDERRRQRLLQMRAGDEAAAELGNFLAPWRFDGFTRCDLHPRLHPDASRICIDSAHTGIRRVYVLSAT